MNKTNPLILMSFITSMGVWIGCSLCLGDELVLRSGKVLQSVNVVTMDEDGVLLEDGSLYSLDAISSASLKEQDEFNRLHTRVSHDLFRLKIRLRRGDIENLQPHLQRLYPMFLGRNSRSAVVVELGKLRESVQQGRFDLALLSHFHLFTLASANKQNQDELNRWNYQIDDQSGMAGVIYPLGVSPKLVLENWQAIEEAYRGLPENHPTGLDFYFFQVAKLAGAEVDPALNAARLKLTSMESMLLNTLESGFLSASGREWELARGRFIDQPFGQEDSLIHRSLFYLVRGLLELNTENGNRNQGYLDLLKSHATFGHKTESLSAAGLLHAAHGFRVMGMVESEKSVSEELLTRYPSSYFAKQIKLRVGK